MSDCLPTAEQLEKLPMRAVAAYAARSALRLSSELRGLVPDRVLDDLPSRIEAVSTEDRIEALDRPALAYAAHDVIEAYAHAPLADKCLDRFRVVFCLIHAMLAAVSTAEAVVHGGNMRRWRRSVAEEAERALRSIQVRADRAAIAAVEAARRDYELLVAAYGEHDEVIIGDPVDCFHGEGEQ